MQDAPQEKILRRIVQYVRHWMRWVLSEVTDVQGMMRSTASWETLRSTLSDHPHQR
jgi:hypothetical protein